MAEVIRDEEVRRRVRLAQEFLDPGAFGGVQYDINADFV
jgi:hypothetical protein